MIYQIQQKLRRRQDINTEVITGLHQHMRMFNDTRIETGTGLSMGQVRKMPNKTSGPDRDKTAPGHRPIRWGPKGNDASHRRTISWVLIQVRFQKLSPLLMSRKGLICTMSSSEL